MQTTPPATQQALVELFTERARAVAALVTTVQSVEEAAHLIASTEAPTATRRYTATSQLLSRYPELRQALQARGIDLRVAEEVDDETDGPHHTAASLAGDIGLVLGQAGVAETGSFLSVEETLAARLLGMLSDTVYALLPASSIVPTLDEMGRTLSQLSREGTRYVSLITGPSRTADIERVLTIGVQGPKVLHVIVVDED
ncbi:MAG: L-lactate dehydrogenase complex protein LldG [Chloroflexia bacterium]|nr:L-lactate dehydrogenase complex protein LldG [Chloroflexia bacterium]